MVTWTEKYEARIFDTFPSDVHLFFGTPAVLRGFMNKKGLDPFFLHVFLCYVICGYTEKKYPVPIFDTFPSDLHLFFGDAPPVVRCYMDGEVQFLRGLS